MKKENTFWGLVFIIGAIVLLTSRFGLFHLNVSLWSIFLTVVCCAWMVKSIAKVEFFGIFIPAALLCCIYDDFLHIQSITPGPVLGAAVLLSIGCNMIFPSAKRHKYHNNYMGNEENSSSQDGDYVMYSVNFKSAVNYINSNHFQQADLSISFGSLKVYFDNAIMANEEATLFIDNNFAGLDLYIPKGWRISNQMDCAFGGVEERGNVEWDGVHTLILKGDTNFGGVVIYYV